MLSERLISMAGDWIKMRVDLADDPAVVGIAASTGLDELAVVGRLHKFWSWADKHTVAGNAAGVTYLWLDRYLNADGFAMSLEECGWLTCDGASISIPNFDVHNGQPGKRRSLAAKRAAKNKAKRLLSSDNAFATKQFAISNAPSVTRALAREEKRREEKKRI